MSMTVTIGNLFVPPLTHGMALRAAEWHTRTRHPDLYPAQ